MNIHFSEKAAPRRRRLVRRTTFHWTEQAITTAERMWSQGRTASSIGSRLGVSRGSVTAMASTHRDRFPARAASVATKRGLPKSGPRLSISIDWQKTAVALWAEGASGNKIAKLTGVKSGTAYHRIKMRPDLFPEVRERAVVVVTPSAPKSYLGNGRWVDRVPYTTFKGAVVSLPRVSILNGKEA